MKKKILLPVMVGLLMVLATVGVTYAFFNYTRTGGANTVKTGTVNFTSSQTTINLSNVFPIASSAVSTDTNNVGTATITVAGDTSYDKGIEYLISAINVTNTLGTKNIPISINATTSGTLGTSDEDYFDNRDSATNHIYKVLAKDTISNDDQLMVGYIANNATGINGTITIKAYIDKDKILISDTYPEGEVVIDGVTYYNGTPTTNKTVFTTTEWNSLNTNGISFQVKVEANEGTWVSNPEGRNDMKNTINNTVFTSQQKSSINEINFIKMNEANINAHNDLIDFTASGGQGMVKGWIENNKLYIASPGIIYFPVNSQGLFNSFTALQTINFGNVNTSLVTDMGGMFHNCSSLTYLDLTKFNTENVSSMAEMFGGCSNLSILDLSSFTTSSLNVTAQMFQNCSSLTTIYVNSSWDVSGANASAQMFYNCTSLKGGGSPQTTYDANHVDKEYARIDGGANSSTPGYLTLKTN